MKLIKILIIENDINYADALSDYLIFNHSEKFKIITGYDGDFIKNAFLNEGKFDIVLLSRDFESYLLESDVTRIILDEEGESSQINGINAIYKYQTGEEIVSDMLDFYIKGNNTD